MVVVVIVVAVSAVCGSRALIDWAEQNKFCAKSPVKREQRNGRFNDIGTLHSQPSQKCC